MKRDSPWWKHSFWNTLEHGITRGSDAVATLVLLWSLPTETFSKLALAQAVVAPLLIAFVSPASVVYRDYGRWKAEGARALSGRLSALRWYGRALGVLAVALSAAIAWGIRGAEPAPQRFYALLWAFGLAVGGQLSGADREYLRMELKLKQLNAITLFQKSTVLGGTVLVAFAFGGRLDFLAGVVAFSMVASALWAERSAYDAGSLQKGGPDLNALKDVMKDYTLWNHLNGVIMNWVQSMDLFFLGVFRYPAIQLGLYAAALKLANLTNILPNAFTNIFAIWAGRRAPGEHGPEREKARSLTGLLAGACLAQAALIALLSPWIIAFLSRGRWNADQQGEIRSWLLWILAGNAVYFSASIWAMWINIRGRMSRLTFRIFVPWGAASLAIYAYVARFHGPSGAAWANLPVGAVYLLLTLWEERRIR